MGQWRAAAAAFLFFGAAGLYYIHGLQASGDEPHYLLMARSIWGEGDLDLRDNAAREEYRADVPGTLAPHYGWARRDGRPYPAHGAGLPFLLAPAVGLGGRAGAVLVLALCGALLVGETIRWARLLAPAREDTALWAGLLIALSPVFFYSFHVYTEVPSALCAWLATRLVWERRGPWSAAAAALLASALPWLHVKMVPAALVVAAVALWRLPARERLVFTVTASIVAALYVAYLHSVFGGLAPVLGIYGGATGAAATGAPLRGAVGLLLDRSYGLLPYAPSLVCGLAALLWLDWRRLGGPLGAALLLGATIVLPAVLWRQWWGGQCPPARLLVPALPLLALLAARRREAPGHGLARAVAPLTALQLAIVLFAVWRPQDRLLLNRTNQPARLWAALGGDGWLAEHLPAVAGNAAWTMPTLAWIGLLVVVLAWDRFAGRPRQAC